MIKRIVCPFCRGNETNRKYVSLSLSSEVKHSQCHYLCVGIIWHRLALSGDVKGGGVYMNTPSQKKLVIQSQHAPPTHIHKHARTHARTHTQKEERQNRQQHLKQG